jgi:hypothetical protein
MLIRRRLILGCVASVLLLAAQPLCAGILNGSFENPSIGPWTVIGPGGQVTPSFDGVSPTDGAKMALIDTGTGALPTFILDLVLDNALGVGPGYLASAFPSAVQGSLLYQSFTLSPGESIVAFDWNFMTNESLQSTSSNDIAFAHLISAGSLVDSTSVDTFASFPDSGTIYANQTGWNSLAFSNLTPGAYSIVFGVIDAGSAGNASALLVDNVRAVPEPSAAALLLVAAGGFLFRGRNRRPV